MRRNKESLKPLKKQQYKFKCVSDLLIHQKKQAHFYQCKVLKTMCVSGAELINTGAPVFVIPVPPQSVSNCTTCRQSLLGRVGQDHP